MLRGKCRLVRSTIAPRSRSDHVRAPRLASDRHRQLPTRARQGGNHMLLVSGNASRRASVEGRGGAVKVGCSE